MSSNITIPKEKRISALGIVIICLALIAVFFGGIAAKYVSSSDGQGIFAAREFWFTSNLLTEAGESYVLNSDAGSIDIVLGNNADALRYSDEVVRYEVSVKGGPAGDPAVIDPESSASGSLANTSVSNATITIKNLKPGETYEVTAVGYTAETKSSLLGFEKTLKATFAVSDNGAYLYKHVDSTDPNYVILTVWSKNVTGVLNATFNIAGLVPDSTDSALAEMTNYSNGAYAADSFEDARSFVSAYSSRTYRFFKSDAGAVTDNSFEVILTDSSSRSYVAESSTPR